MWTSRLSGGQTNHFLSHSAPLSLDADMELNLCVFTAFRKSINSLLCLASVFRKPVCWGNLYAFSPTVGVKQIGLLSAAVSVGFEMKVLCTSQDKYTHIKEKKNTI